MTTYVADYGTYTALGNIIGEVNIELRMNDLNYAVFVCPTAIPVDTMLTIKYGLATDVFTGKVTQCRKLARTIDGKTRYEVELVEPAIELSNNYITTATTTGIYLKNMNKRTPKTLGWFVQNIISSVSSNGWKDVSSYSIKQQTTPPGGTEGTDLIPSMGFSTSTVWTALNRVVCTIFNYGLWFDYKKNGAIKEIRYGEYRSDINIFPVPISVSIIQNSNNYGVDGVIVYGETNDLYTTIGNTAATKKVVAYRYNKCQSVDELKWVAQRIWESRSEPQIRYEIVFPGQYFKICEGDRLHIYDEQSGLAYSKYGYGVKDVKITQGTITVGIGAPKMTIFELLNDRLSIIDGNILSFDPLPIDTGWINIPASSDPEEWGATTDISVMIRGSTFLGGYFLLPTCGGETIEGAGYYRIYATVADWRDEVTITPAEPLEISGEDVLESGWFPWSWKWVDIEAHYIFGDETEEDSQVDWTLTWGNEEKPELYTVENGMISDYGGSTYSSAVYSTVLHRWLVNSTEGAPYSWPTIMVECHTGTTVAVLKDIMVRMAIYYDASGTYPPFEATCAEGVMQMRAAYGSDPEALNYTDWITIYDTDSPTDYIGKEYDMGDYIDYTNFATGEHKIQCRLKGTGNAAVYLEGRYTSFNEKTRVIE